MNTDKTRVQILGPLPGSTASRINELPSGVVGEGYIDGYVSTLGGVYAMVVEDDGTVSAHLLESLVAVELVEAR